MMLINGGIPLKWLVVVLASAISSCGGCSGMSLEGDATTTDSPADYPPDTHVPDTGVDTPHESVPDPVIDSIEDTAYDTVELPPGHYWARTYGTNDGLEQAMGVFEKEDRGLVVAGSLHDSDLHYPGMFALMELDQDGNIVRQTAIPELRFVTSLAATADGGFAGAGGSSVARLDSEWGVEWSMHYLGTLSGSLYGIRQTSDGGFIVVGETPGGALLLPQDVWVMRLDPDGGILWQYRYGGSDGERGMDIDEADDGGFVAVGILEARSDDHDALVLKLDPAGGLEWAVRYGGEGFDDALEVHVAADGGIVVAGQKMESSATPLRFWVLRLDTEGEVEWQKAIDGTFYDLLNDAQMTEDGGCVLAGITRAGSPPYPRYDAWIVKLDAAGEIAWQRSYGGSGDMDESSAALAVGQAADGSFLISGMTRAFGLESMDWWVLRTDARGVISESCPPTVGAATGATSFSTSASRSAEGYPPSETSFEAEPAPATSSTTYATSATQCAR